MTDSYSEGARFAVERYGSVYGGHQPEAGMSDEVAKARMAHINGLPEFYDKMSAKGSPMPEILRALLSSRLLERKVPDRSDEALSGKQAAKPLADNLG